MKHRKTLFIGCIVAMILMVGCNKSQEKEEESNIIQEPVNSPSLEAGDYRVNYIDKSKEVADSIIHALCNNDMPEEHLQSAYQSIVDTDTGIYDLTQYTEEDFDIVYVAPVDAQGKFKAEYVFIDPINGDVTVQMTFVLGEDLVPTGELELTVDREVV